jgi:putative ABC transport system permease protein
MFVLRLLLKNAFRHRLRTLLTLVGLVVAVCAFGLLRSVIEAWHAGVEASSSTRLVTRNNIALTFSLPRAYEQKLRAADGVTQVSWANFFGGVYITERNFFPQFAVEPRSYLALYPEYVLPDEQKAAFFRDRQGAVAGRKLAAKFGWQIGDNIPLRGTIYPGNWNFTLRGIWEGADAKTDESQLLFHWDMLNEFIRAQRPAAADSVGAYIVGIADPQAAAEISQRIDASFKNSLAETLTETEAAFQLSFVSMSEALLLAIDAVSSIIVLIIMAVMANTMAMSARERLAEYATLKSLGFPPGFIVRLLYGESLLIAAIGGALGLAVTLPLAAWIGSQFATLFPTFGVSPHTMALQIAAALGVGAVAAAWPAWRMSRIEIVQGLRHIG